MTDFLEVLKTFGKALIKLLIGLSVGFGVGLLTLGIIAVKQPDLWKPPMIYEDPPLTHIFLGSGAGLLAFTTMLVLLFYGPWVKKDNPSAGSQDNPSPVDRPQKTVEP